VQILGLQVTHSSHVIGVLLRVQRPEISWLFFDLSTGG